MIRQDQVKNSANFILLEKFSKASRTTSLLGLDGLGMNLRPFVRRLTSFSFKGYELKLSTDAGDIASLSISLKTPTSETLVYSTSSACRMCGGKGQIFDIAEVQNEPKIPK